MEGSPAAASPCRQPAGVVRTEQSEGKGFRDLAGQAGPQLRAARCMVTNGLRETSLCVFEVEDKCYSEITLSCSLSKGNLSLSSHRQSSAGSQLRRWLVGQNVVNLELLPFLFTFFCGVHDGGEALRPLSFPVVRFDLHFKGGVGADALIAVDVVQRFRVRHPRRQPPLGAFLAERQDVAKTVSVLIVPQCWL